MRGSNLIVVLACAVLGAACGGSCPEAASVPSSPPESPPGEASEAEHAEGEEANSSEEEGSGTKVAEPADGESGASPGSKPSGPSKAEPSFPEHASVAQAMAAVPQGSERANLDSETLAEPLQHEALYEPCKVGGQHFKVKVAVWNGRAVGVDVTTPNKKLAQCIDERVRSVEWRDKVPSLNTIEYSM